MKNKRVTHECNGIVTKNYFTERGYNCSAVRYSDGSVFGDCGEQCEWIIKNQNKIGKPDKDIEIDKEEFNKLREKLGVNIAKKICVKDAIFKAIEEANTIEDIKVILRKIVEEMKQ